MGDDNSAAFAELDRMIRVCRSMPGMAEKNAPRVAELLNKVISTSVASGTSPEGEAWKPTADGHMPLRGAMAAVTVTPDSSGVTATLEGYHVFHQRGTKSQGANKASKAAGGARKGARAAAKVARKAARKQSSAEKTVARQIEKRGKATAHATEKLQFAQSSAKRMAARSGAEEAHAGKMTAAAGVAAGVGGLPARPIIPQMMPMNLSESLRELFTERWKAHMGGEG